MKKREIVPLCVLAALSVAMYFIPPPERVVHDIGDSVRARVVEVDDSGVVLTGLLEYGTEKLVVELPDGSRRPAVNELRAQLDLDKKFRVGDTALVTMSGQDPLVTRDHWRMGWMMALFLAFATLLAVFGGVTGLKALFSFVFSCFTVWKLLVPLCLSGWSASWTAFAAVSILTAVIMYLVAGPTRKGLVAFLGAMLGVAASLGLAGFFASAMHVNGATMPFVQALLYSGFESIDLADVFIGAVILGSSGAVMDLAMDIAAGIAEVARHSPGLPRTVLFMSAVRMGRAVVGTMTTTLLLAYSGGYLTLLMVFAAQGTAPMDFLNSTLVSAEIVKTLVGSFGLVLVAPFTAMVGAVVFGRKI